MLVVNNKNDITLECFRYTFMGMIHLERAVPPEIRDHSHYIK